MPDKTKVWIRSSVLDTIVFGKNKTNTARAIPGAGSGGAGAFDENATYYSSYTVNTTNSNMTTGTNRGGDSDDCVNWGWSRGFIVEDSNDKTTANSKTSSDNPSGAEETIKVYITDQDSIHCNTDFNIPFNHAFSKGDLVMDNTYGDHHQHLFFDDSDDEDEDGGDGYDFDYGGGYDDGPNSNNKALNRGKPEQKYPDDLIILTHLHEPSVVYCMRKRYSFDKIYTSTGPILIALNPFKNCKALYSEAVMKQYWNRGEKRMSMNSTGGGSGHAKKNEPTTSGATAEEEDIELPPHVYATADHSFRNMMTKLEENKEQSDNGGSGGRGPGRRAPPSKKGNNNKTGCCNQSILVSGESGAGKTVTTKFIMQYLATLSKRSSTDGGRRHSLTASGGKTDIEQQVLQSNPILESFGNARTIRNDNSSRFGKFIEIQFTETGSLVGANIETYLLEKVRLISQTDGERNYHIFYEILQGMEDDDLDKYFLTDYTAEDFKMTNQSDTYDRRDGVCDYDTFQDLLHAMETMGFATIEQADIMSVTCALLHASNLTLNSINAGDESEIDRSNLHLKPILTLLGITADSLNRALCYFSITAGREKHTRSNSKEKAEKGLLAFIKATYGALFTYVVKRVNESITIEDTSSKRGGNKSNAAASIGVLDIFGFESFKSNSFEQLCINYCNETLQQQFNMFVLKNEQDEYEKEGIQWSFISFPDNQDALDLIDKRGSGILSILDDQCRAPGTTDKTFVNDVYQKLSRHPRLEANRRQVGSRKFGIVHYAGTVEYSSKGFVDKNRDDLPKEATDLLLSSSNDFVKTLGQIINGPSNTGNSAPKGRAPSKNSKLTVGGQFSRQLQELRLKIDNTLPHYVRCLKPNDELVPDHFDPLIVADQLRCAGVIEAVRVSRVGYPQRYSHARFLARYHILGQNALKQAARASRRRKPVDVLVESIAIQIRQQELNEEKPDKEPVDLVSVGIQVGKTKVFLRRKAYEGLEQLRNRQTRNGAIKIQALGRSYIVKREYTQSRNAIISLQCFIRTNIAQKIVQEKRRIYNATRIQTFYRRAVACRTFIAIKLCSQCLQKIHRGNIGRARYQRMNRERKALILQKYWRMFFAFKQFKHKQISSLILQCAWRCAQSRKELKALRIAARDLNNTAQERDKLREENRKLQNALADALSRDNKAESSSQDFEMREKDLLLQIERLEESCTLKETQMGKQKVCIEKIEDELKIALVKVVECDKKEERLVLDASNKVEEAKIQIHQLEELCAIKNKEIEAQKLDMEELKDELKISSSKIDSNDENERNALADALNRVNAGDIYAKSLETEKRELMARICHLEESCATKDNEMKGQKLGLETIHISPEVEPRNEDGAVRRDLLDRANEAEACVQNLETERGDLLSKINELEESCFLKDKEKDEQRMNIDKLKDQLKCASNRFQTLESKASREMNELIDEFSHQSDHISSSSRAASPMFSLAAESDEVNDRDEAHIACLEKEVDRLKRKLTETEEASTSMKNNTSLQKEVDRLKKKLIDTKKTSAEEILTLQDEVERLNKELRSIKRPQDDVSEISDGMGQNDQITKMIDSCDEGNNIPDGQLAKMIDLLMTKDIEIRQLRQEISSLRDQLDETTMSMLSDSRFHDDTDDRSVISRIFTRTPYSRSGGSVRSGLGEDPSKLSLRRANAELKRELEAAKEDLDECRFELEEEKERSGKEIKAFGDALKGVDELRKSAEAMSRQIIQLKQRDDDEVPEDPFEEIDEGKVQLEKAKRMIGTASLKSEQPSIWRKMRLSVRSLNEEVIPEESDYKGKQGYRSHRGRNDDDSSVFTSPFF